MPNSKNYKRDFRKEYDSYHSSPEQREKRSSRNKARRKAEKIKGKSFLRGKDVHHKDGNPKNNSSSNLAVTSKKTNRSFKRNKNAGKK